MGLFGEYQGWTPTPNEIRNWQKDTFGQKRDENDPNWNYRDGNNDLYDAQRRDQEAAKTNQTTQGGGGSRGGQVIRGPFGLKLTLPKLRECKPKGVPLRNPGIPLPPVPGTFTDPWENSSSTNGGTNRPINWGTNPSNITIREAPSNVNTNPTSTNRITNGPRISYPILR